MPHSNYNSNMKTNNLIATIRTIGIALLLLCVNVKAFADDKKGDEDKKARRRPNTINYSKTRRKRP